MGNNGEILGNKGEVFLRKEYPGFKTSKRWKYSTPKMPKKVLRTERN